MPTPKTKKLKAMKPKTPTTPKVSSLIVDKPSTPVTPNVNSSGVIIIGIDFGTTYSGVAYTWSNKSDKVKLITSWDTDNYSSSNEEKNPTTLSFGPKNEVEWGYSVPKEADQVKWFKLLLIDEEDLPDDVRFSSRILEARSYLKKHNKTPVEVIAVYLRHLWNHAIQRITETVSRALVNYSKYHVVMTLPAIWPDYSRSRMREAARLAGIMGYRAAGETELSFLSEPEAGAIATLADMEGRQDVKTGDSFVVVDCGGGTADVVSYSVTQADPMLVRECVKGEGGLCGAVFVDEAFIELMKVKIGPMKWTRLTSDTRQRLIYDEWEHGIKQRFDARPNKTWSFNLPWECLDPSERLSRRDALLTSGLKYAILVGGFGRCKYLFQRVKTQTHRTLSDNIEVLQARGAEPWTAICSGVVLHASSLRGLGSLSIKVDARISRASYGIKVSELWDPVFHVEEDKFWSEKHQEWRATNQISWFLKEGDDISTKKPIKKPFFRRFFPENGTQVSGLEECVCTTAISPPSSRIDSTVSQLCCIKWDLVVDVLSVPTRTNSLGKVYHYLEFEVEMTCSGSSIDFAVIYNGKRQGPKNVTVEYRSS